MVEFRSRLSYGSAGVPERDRTQRTGGRGCARYNWRCPDRSGSDKAVRSAGIRSRSCVKLALLVGKPCKFLPKPTCPVSARLSGIWIISEWPVHPGGEVSVARRVGG